MTTMTQSEFSRHIDVNRAYITQLKQAGRLVMDGNKVDVEASIARIAATRDPSVVKPGDTTPDYQQARALREHYNALIAKAEYEEKIRQLIPAGEVAKFVADACTIIRAGLESLPETLAPQLAAETDEHIVQSVMAAHVERLLQEMADKFKQGLNI